MSAGSSHKRLAKRSILGTKVMVPGQDGRYYPGHIQALKTCGEDFGGGGSGSGSGSGSDQRYSVRFESTRRVFEFAEKDIIGPAGFGSMADVQLLQGQKVFVTHNNREMAGVVVRHDFDSQDVLITVNGNNEEETVLTKIDDVRLLESRKSARLVNSDTDFSKLADISISSADKKKNKSSIAIEVPRTSASDYVQIAGTRKRRTSENLPEDEEILSECSAAMLLMKLSCSPRSPGLLTSPTSSASFSSSSLVPGSAPVSAYTDLPSSPSPDDELSESSSLFRSATPSPPLSSSATTDEGIVRDVPRPKKKNKQIIYQCTFPGCAKQCSSVKLIETHVRQAHLNRHPEESDDEHEEEFYYTELELSSSFPSRAAGQSVVGRGGVGTGLDPPSRRMASLSLVDHMDMARPAHEEPHRSLAMAAASGGGGVDVPVPKSSRSISINVAGNNNGGQVKHGLLSRSLPAHSTLTQSMMGSPGKMILISPPARSPHGSGESSLATPTGKSPVRRPRDSKKCRKVYGLEQRDMWCTQCKWKKACARFGPAAVSGSGESPASSLSASLTASGMPSLAASPPTMSLAPKIAASSANSTTTTTLLTIATTGPTGARPIANGPSSKAAKF